MNIKKRKDFFDKCLSGMDIREASKAYVPKTIFKYRSGNSKNSANEFYDIEALENNYLWMPNIYTLNDPYDCSVYFEWDKKYADKLQINDLEGLDNNIINNSLKDYEKKFREQWGIVSFSERIDSILMWSHYSNEHKGFCIEYNTSDFISYFFPVIYTDKIPNSLENGNCVITSVLTKAYDWKYELEWRIVNRYIDFYEPEGNIWPAPKPVAIYLGCRIDENKELKEKLLKYAEKNQIIVFAMEKRRDSYKLDKYVLYDFR